MLNNNSANDFKKHIPDYDTTFDEGGLVLNQSDFPGAPAIPRFLGVDGNTLIFGSDDEDANQLTFFKISEAGVISSFDGTPLIRLEPSFSFTPHA